MTYKTLDMYIRLGYWPNIRHPRTLNEKIAHRQLLAPHPLAPLVADKWRVREYVAERGLTHILNEVYHVTDNPATIPFDDLPDKFVIKANHGSGWNIIIHDRSACNRQAISEECRHWLSLKYGKTTRSYETHYDSIPPLILVEKFIEDNAHRIPLDYKIDCFHGVPHSMGVRCLCADGDIYSRYDTSWNQQYFITSKGPYRNDAQFPRPAKLEALLDVASRLSQGIDYCRVDLYLANDKDLLFGEITLNPAGGLNPISREWDFKLGALW